MKKMLNVLLIMFALTVMNSGCEKDSDSDKPATNTSESVITLPELTGDWAIVSTYIHMSDGSHDFTGCDGMYFSYPFLRNYGPILISFKFTSSLCTMTDKCTSVNFVTNTPFKIEGKYIVVGNNREYVFEIISYNKLTKTLELHDITKDSIKQTIRKL